MNTNNFINHGDDPTLPLDLSSVTLQQQYEKLSERDKALVFCKLNGYSFIPPSIERMYGDEYYLGNDHFFGNNGSVIFDFWKREALPKIFGGPEGVLTKKPYLILSGAIGIGKSTITRLCLAMTYARLLAMKNPSKTLGLAPKPLSAVIFHRSEETAQVEFARWFKYSLFQDSPFFKNTKNDALKFKIITSGPRGSGGLGSDVVFFTLGEINFWPNQEQAQGKLTTSLIRFKSRFSNDALQKCGFFIVDSSAKGSSDCTEWFLDNTDPRYTWNCKPAHYEVRPNMYKESRGKTFKVFTGNSTIPPQILPEDNTVKVDLELDKDKIIDVPIQLIGEYKQDIIKALQDFSGISTGSSDLFFQGGIEHLVKCSTIKNQIPEVITVDFYNKQERLIDKIQPMIQLLPMHTPLWVGLDLSAAKGGDMTGISAVTFEGWELMGNVRMPKVKCWFTVAIKNKDGQEISLFHIEQLLQDLNKRYYITVAADQAFSRQILQMCDREGIKNFGRISTDLVPCEPAIYLKNIIQNELIEIPFHKRLQREASDLYYTPKGKIDHPKKATISKEFDNPDGKQIGSKDVWDSLAQASYCLKLSLDEGDEQGWSGGHSKQMQALKQLTTSAQEESMAAFQDMLNNIF